MMITIANNRTGSNYANFVDAYGNGYFFSYDTLIAFSSRKTGLVVRENVWGSTTGKHLNAISDDKSIRVSKEEFDRKYEEAFAQ